MYDKYNTLPWKASWYAACGIPKDGAWYLPITTEATNNLGQCLPSRGKASSTSETYIIFPHRYGKRLGTGPATPREGA